MTEGLPSIGDRIADKYVVESEMASGGMGVVLAARHEVLGQRVAIKVLRAELTAQEEILKRFLREAQASVELRSEHVVRVFDVGTLESGAPYMVMEFLEGNDLSDEIESRGVMPTSESVDYIIEACHALAEAHKKGIVHRDIKPANLFLTREPDGGRVIKVVDFGISKVLEESRLGRDQSLTQTMTMLGSPQYMSPEQVRSSRDVDQRTDVWALGCVLYELLCGVAPFSGESVSAVAACIVADDPPPLQRFRPDIAPELSALTLRCLKKDREARFQSVGALARALQGFATDSHRTIADRVSSIDPLRLDMSGPGITTARQFPGEAVVLSASALSEPQVPSSRSTEPGPATHPESASPLPDTMIATASADSPLPPKKSSRFVLLLTGATLGAVVALWLSLSGTSDDSASLETEPATGSPASPHKESAVDATPEEPETKGTQTEAPSQRADATTLPAEPPPEQAKILENAKQKNTTARSTKPPAAPRSAATPAPTIAPTPQPAPAPRSATPTPAPSLDVLVDRE